MLRQNQDAHTGRQGEALLGEVGTAASAQHQVEDHDVRLLARRACTASAGVPASPTTS